MSAPADARDLTGLGDAGLVSADPPVRRQRSAYRPIQTLVPQPVRWVKGRGAVSRLPGRYETQVRQQEDDGWDGGGYDQDGEPVDRFGGVVQTEVKPELVRSALSFNDSPDIGFDRSLNPYRGCEHGCIYCYARPTHAWLQRSPGLDFETRLTAKQNMPEVLLKELASATYRAAPVNIGSITDAYQPVERDWQLTRRLLEILLQTRHPATIVTKNALILRDLDLLKQMAALNLVSVHVSVTTLDPQLCRILEPRASAPWRRLQAINTLTQAGVPVALSLAPIIPFINDDEIEKIIASAAQAGATRAMAIMLRLPWEVAPLFDQWLRQHYPDRADRVLARVRDLRDGKLNDPNFRDRMRGKGIWADLIQQRLARAVRQAGMVRGRFDLDSSLFVAPSRGGQQRLF